MSDCTGAPSRNRILRRRGARCGVAIALSLALFMAASGVPVEAESRVRLALRSSYPAASAGFYLAIARGYYADVGIDVDLVEIGEPGAGEERAAELLSEGIVDLAVGGTDVLVETVPTEELVVVFSIFQTSPGRMFLKSDRRISTITGLADVPIVLPLPGSRLATELSAVLAINGIPLSALRTVVVEPGEGAVAAILGDDVAGFPGSLMSTDFVMSQFGVDIVPIDPGAFGLDFYGDTVFAERAWAERHADLVERFRVASVRGWEEAMGDTAAVADWMVDEHELPAVIPPSIPEREFVEWQLERVRALTGYPVVDVGYSSVVRWGRIIYALDGLGIANPGVVHDRFVFHYDEIIGRRRSRRVALLLLVSGGLAAALFAAMASRSAAMRARLRVELEQLIDGLLHGVGYFRRDGEAYRLVRGNAQLHAAASPGRAMSDPAGPEASEVLERLGVPAADAAALVEEAGSRRVEQRRESRSTDGDRMREIALFPLGNDALGIAVLDVTAQETVRSALESVVHQRTVTIREIHHRVRNNMQIMTSLMNLQATTLKSGEARRYHQKVSGQIRSLSVAHDMLYDDFIQQSIGVGDFARRIAHATIQQNNQSGERCVVEDVVVAGDAAASIPLDTAVPVGLITYEAISNSCHHAFDASTVAPRIEVRCGTDDDAGVRIEIVDNGHGYDTRASESGTTGIAIMRVLAEQIGATLDIASGPTGTRVSIRLQAR